MMFKSLTVALCAALMVALAGCTSDAGNTYRQRVEEQKTAAATGETLEQKNLKEKLKREQDANHVGYVYLVNFGKPFGYYVIKGKVSSSGSQVGPETEIACPPGYGPDACNTVDSKQDDNTYGQGDTGIFFFLTNGTMVETTLDYIYSDEPLAIDVPLLSKK